MSTTDGEAASRLDNALADVLSAGASDGDPAREHVVVPESEADWSVDGPDDDAEPYTLPEIVPATSPPRAVVAAPPTPSQPPATAPVAPAPDTSAPAHAGAWGEQRSALPASAQGTALRAPGRRPRVRRVTRVLRHIDPWSTFKVALLFSVVAYVVTLTAGVLLWRVADSTGTLDNVERWFTQFGWETFELKGGEIFHNAWIMGLFGAVALTGGLVLLATLFNLVSDIVGGVRLTVLEEEVVERTVSSTRRYVVRRTPAAGGPAAEQWDVDDDSAPPTTTAAAGAGSDRQADDWSVGDAADDDAADNGATPG